MDEIIYMCDYSSRDLEPIIENLELTVETLNISLQELVASKVYSEWLLGLNIAIIALLIIIIFAIFFANYK